LVKVVPDNDD
jgi:hypothetical protein